MEQVVLSGPGEHRDGGRRSLSVAVPAPPGRPPRVGPDRPTHRGDQAGEEPGGHHLGPAGDATAVPTITTGLTAGAERRNARAAGAGAPRAIAAARSAPTRTRSPAAPLRPPRRPPRRAPGRLGSRRGRRPAGTKAARAPIATPSTRNGMAWKAMATNMVVQWAIAGLAQKVLEHRKERGRGQSRPRLPSPRRHSTPPSAGPEAAQGGGWPTASTAFHGERFNRRSARRRRTPCHPHRSCAMLPTPPQLSSFRGGPHHAPSDPELLRRRSVRASLVGATGVVAVMVPLARPTQRGRRAGDDRGGENAVRPLGW